MRVIIHKTLRTLAVTPTVSEEGTYLFCVILTPEVTISGSFSSIKKYNVNSRIPNEDVVARADDKAHNILGNHIHQIIYMDVNSSSIISSSLLENHKHWRSYNLRKSRNKNKAENRYFLLANTQS